VRRLSLMLRRDCSKRSRLARRMQPDQARQVASTRNGSIAILTAIHTLLPAYRARAVHQTAGMHPAEANSDTAKDDKVFIALNIGNVSLWAWL